MSLLKQLKDAESQIAALQGQVAEAHELIDAQTKSHAEETAQSVASIQKLMDGEAKLAADLEKARTEATATAEKITTLETERAQVAEQVAKMEQALADPSFLAAGAQGAPPVAGSGEPKETMTRDQANAAYAKITDPGERDKFRSEHKTELGL